jgi:SAM-dependent methyltransferase
VGDARHLPFRRASLDAVFSYSVLQHFSKPDARQAFRQLASVVKPGGLIRIQMASATGIRSLQHIARRRFAEPANFEVRYWFPSRLLQEFKQVFGNSQLEVDCYFGLGLQPTDYQLYGRTGRILLRVSERLRKASLVLPPLRYCADSVYLIGTNDA